MIKLLLIISLLFTWDFTFGNIKVDTSYIDSDGIMHINIYSLKDSFAIERLVQKDWVIETVFGIDSLKGFEYKPAYHSGLNTFRIRGITSKYIYKNELIFINSDIIVCGPKRCTDKFKLPYKSEYKLANSDGRIIKEGNSDFVDLRGLDTGVYYVEYGNKTEKFFKK